MKFKVILAIISLSFCINVQSRSIKKKKPYNGKYVLLEFNSCNYNRSSIGIGYGWFKSVNKGYEVGLGRLYITKDWRMEAPHFFTIYANKFKRQMLGKKFNGVGYKLGINYSRISERNEPIDYISKELLVTSAKGSYSIDKLVFHNEVFFNLRLFKQVYVEFGLGLQNGIEHRTFHCIENLNSKSYPIAYYGGLNDGPGYYFRSNFTGNVRLISCFGKNKR